MLLESLSLLPVSGLLVLALMTLCWAFSRKLGKIAVIDTGWTLSLTFAVFFYLFRGDAPWLRKGLAGGMVLCWAARLVTHLANRLSQEGDDPRYVAWTGQWHGARELKIFFFFWLQGAVAWFFSIPFFWAALNERPALSPLEGAAAVLWFAAFLGESAADAQLRKFKADPRNRGLTCRAGLWRYSRHPNYFCEWLIWVAWFLFSSASPGGWTSAAHPLLMFYFLWFVTGVPKAEARALQTRGEDYRRYQRETSAFFPWFPRKEKG